MMLRYVCDHRRHLICVPYSIENLHAMARELDIDRCWFHKDHYDIPKRRIDEIAERCMIVSPRCIWKIIMGKMVYDTNGRQLIAVNGA